MGRARCYTPEEIEAGLLALAKTGGNTRQAAETLKETGPRPMGHQQLSRLRRVHAERYEQICREVWPEIERTVKQGFVDFIAQAQETQALALQKTHEQLENGEAKDPARIVKDLAIAKGVAFDKWQLAEGKPTQINGHTNADELLTRLSRLAPAFSDAVIEGKAEEIVNRTAWTGDPEQDPSKLASGPDTADKEAE